MFSLKRITKVSNSNTTFNDQISGWSLVTLKLATGGALAELWKLKGNTGFRRFQIKNFLNYLAYCSLSSALSW